MIFGLTAQGQKVRVPSTPDFCCTNHPIRDSETSRILMEESVLHNPEAMNSVNPTHFPPTHQNLSASRLRVSPKPSSSRQRFHPYPRSPPVTTLVSSPSSVRSFINHLCNISHSQTWLLVCGRTFHAIRERKNPLRLLTSYSFLQYNSQ